MSIKSCVILAAGLGTRMRPLTDNIPKPMVTINGKPLIGHVIDMCLEAGVDNIVMNYHYKPESLQEYILNYYSDYVILSDETELLLNSGGGIVKALPFIKGEEFFVINADCIWYNPDYNALIQMQNNYNPDQFDVFKLLANPKMAIGFDEDPIYGLTEKNHILKSNIDLKYGYTGIQILKRPLFNGFSEKPFSIRHIWDDAFLNNRIGGCNFQGQWLHIGTPQAVLEAEDFLTSYPKGLRVV